MGKTKIATLGEESKKPLEGEVKKPKHGKKPSLKEQKGVHLPGLRGGERVVAVTAEPVATEVTEPSFAKATEGKEKKIRPPKVRGKQYLAARAKIDPKKLYSLEEAVKLARQTSVSKFDGSLELHLVVAKLGLTATVELPHFKGEARKVEIAGEETLKKIAAGKIDFGVLLATPEMMPKLVPYAKILGPRGLMPNPKSGTLVQDPKKALENFKANAMGIKTEKDAPLMHAVVGKTSQPEKELAENLAAVIAALGPKNIKKAVIKATMGPAVRLEIT